MSQAEDLRSAVAGMLQISPDQLRPETSLRGLDSSLGGERLKLGLKRSGLVLPAGTIPATYAELETRVLDPSAKQTSVTSLPVTPVAAVAPAEGVQVGLDVQDIESLPIALDYWDHEFYRGVFDRSELAYAVVQTEPRMHLAGFWCAKEALRKCDPSFAGHSLTATAVAHDSSGKPYLRTIGAGVASRLPHALSISHTATVATAVVIGSPAPEPKPAEIKASQPPRVSLPTVKQPAAFSKLPLALGALLAIALLVYLSVRVLL